MGRRAQGGRLSGDSFQGCQLNGQNPEQAAAAASEQIDAFPGGYKGAPIL